MLPTVSAPPINSLVDAKGDVVTATADNTLARLPVGTDGQVLSSASGATTGLQWVNPFALYRLQMYVTATVSTSGASGNKYVCRGQGDVTTAPTSTAQPFFFNLTAAELAVTGLTTKLRLLVIIKAGTSGPAITVTPGLYPITQLAADTLGTVVTGSTVAVVNPPATADTVANSGDFALPADGLYAVGYTLSGTPGLAFAVHAILQARNV